MPQPIVVLDLDGTLAETAGDLISTLNVIMRGEGLAEIPFEKAKDLIGAGARALIERGFATAGRTLAPERLELLFQGFLVHYEANIAVHSHLFDGAHAALDALAADGYRLAVCTNKIESHAIKLMDILGVGQRFAYVTGKDTFAFCKPDPRHLTETIRLAGGDPARAVMVGDSRTDIDTARNAGIPVVGVTFGYTDIPVEQLGPDRVIGHFRDLPHAVRGLIGATA